MNHLEWVLAVNPPEDVDISTTNKTLMWAKGDYVLKLIEHGAQHRGKYALYLYKNEGGTQKRISRHRTSHLPALVVDIQHHLDTYFP